MPGNYLQCSIRKNACIACDTLRYCRNSNTDNRKWYGYQHNHYFLLIINHKQPSYFLLGVGVHIFLNPEEDEECFGVFPTLARSFCAAGVNGFPCGVLLPMGVRKRDDDDDDENIGLGLLGNRGTSLLPIATPAFSALFFCATRSTIR